MPFICHKTGCQGEIEGGKFVYGDLYEDAIGQRIFNIVDESNEPVRGVKHLNITTWDHWFNRRNTSQSSPSTMVLGIGHSEYLGYDGVPLSKEVV